MQFNKQQGIATLAAVIILLVILGGFAVVTTRVVMQNQTSTKEQYNEKQAYAAAHAGLAYGAALVIQNNWSENGGIISPQPTVATINAQLTNGKVDSLTLTVDPSYAANAGYVKVTAVGASADGTVTRTMSEVVKAEDVSLNIPALVDTSRTGINILNFENGSTIIYGGTTTSINDDTLIANSSTNPSGTSANNTAILNDTQNEFFQRYFDDTMANVKTNASTAGNLYTYAVTHDYANEINGETGKIIYLEQTAGTPQITGTGSVTIGSIESPVIVIIDAPDSGAIELNGADLTIYGVVYTKGQHNNVNLAGVNIIGQLVTAGSVGNSTETVLQGNATIAYSKDIVDSVNNSFGTNFPNSAIVIKYQGNITGVWPGIQENYDTLEAAVRTEDGKQGPVPGTWKDY